MRLILACLVAIQFAVPVSAQESQSLLKDMIQENRSDVDAILLYPEDVRTAIFEACAHPEALVRMRGMQDVSREAFKAFTEELPESDRKMVWEVARYPELVAALTADGKKKSGADIDTIVKRYPEAVREPARQLATSRFDVLSRCRDMNRDTEAAFATFLEPYPAQTQDALRKLVALPEVLEILTENMGLVVLVGDAYTKDPKRVSERAAELSLDAARRNAEAQEAWSKRLQEDPEAVAELEKASKQYAKENGLSTDPPKTTAKVTVTVNPYPYWYGYPYWYASPYWYPYPYWYHAGYYYGPGGTIVIVGTPSYHYTYWHVHASAHHYEYAHLSDHMVHHWEHHRDADGLGSAVDGWVRDNRDRMPKDWLRDDGRRSERLAEYGRFEEAFAKRNRENPGKPIDRETFAKERNKDFPRMSEARGGKQTTDGSRERVSEKRERLKPSGDVKREKPSERDRTRMASDRHRGTWERERTGRGGGGGRSRGGRR